MAAWSTRPSTLRGLSCGACIINDYFVHILPIILREEHAASHVSPGGCMSAQAFLAANGLRLIIRSHEGPDARCDRADLPDMSQCFAIDHVTPAGRLVTVFSAPDYPQFQASAPAPALFMNTALFQSTAPADALSSYKVL